MSPSSSNYDLFVKSFLKLSVVLECVQFGVVPFTQNAFRMPVTCRAYRALRILNMKPSKDTPLRTPQIRDSTKPKCTTETEPTEALKLLPNFKVAERYVANPMALMVLIIRLLRRRTEYFPCRETSPVGRVQLEAFIRIQTTGDLGSDLFAYPMRLNDVTMGCVMLYDYAIECRTISSTVTPDKASVAAAQPRQGQERASDAATDEQGKFHMVEARTVTFTADSRAAKWRRIRFNTMFQYGVMLWAQGRPFPPWFVDMAMLKFRTNSKDLDERTCIYLRATHRIVTYRMHLLVMLGPPRENELYPYSAEEYHAAIHAELDAPEYVPE